MCLLIAASDICPPSAIIKVKVTSLFENFLISFNSLMLQVFRSNKDPIHFATVENNKEVSLIWLLLNVMRVNRVTRIQIFL